MALTLLDIKDDDPRALKAALNDRLRQIQQFVNRLEGGGGGGVRQTIIRERTTTTTIVQGNRETIIHQVLTGHTVIGRPSLDQVPVGSVVVYIIQQPVLGLTWTLGWAAEFHGKPGDAPMSSNTYSVFRFYRVSQAQLLLMDYPLRGEETGLSVAFPIG